MQSTEAPHTLLMQVFRRVPRENTVSNNMHVTSRVQQLTMSEVPEIQLMIDMLQRGQITLVGPLQEDPSLALFLVDPRKINLDPDPNTEPIKYICPIFEYHYALASLKLAQQLTQKEVTINNTQTSATSLRRFLSALLYTLNKNLHHDQHS